MRVLCYVPAEIILAGGDYGLHLNVMLLVQVMGVRDV